MSGYRLLLVTWDGGGVVPPELGLAARLVAAGHQVRVLADPTIEHEALAAGCGFTPWTTAPHANGRRPEDIVIKDWEHRNPLKGMDTYLRDFLADPAPRWAADVDATLAAHPVDGVLVDFALPAAMIPVEARRLPLFGLMPNIWVLPTRGIPPLGPGFLPSRNPVAAVRDAALRSMTTRLFDKALPALNATRADFGLAPVGGTAAQMCRGRMLVMTSPAFDLTSAHQPPDIRYTGPILDDPAWAGPTPDPWAPDDGRPLVLVGLSSGFQDQIGTLNRIADALAALPVRALVTTGLGVDPADVPARRAAGDVVVVPTAPHGRLLGEAAALVTHGGHGTTMKGLAAGVPLLCLPMGRDQNDTAARVVLRGAGLRLKPTASVDAITTAVRRLLDDPGYRRAAGELGRRITSGEGCADPVAEVEEGVRAGAGVHSA